MTKRILSACLTALIAFLFTTEAGAQNLRPEDTFYIKPRVGIAWHLGDTEKSPFNFNMDNWKVDEIPFSAGLELGYQFNQSVSLSAGWQITNHPLAFYYGAEPPPNPETPGVYNGGQLLLRFAAPSRIAPFIGIGAHVTKGQHGWTALTFGPALALGLDIVLTDRLSLVLENTSSFTFPDDGFDAQDDPANPNQAAIPPIADAEDFAPFDLMNALTLGLKINFKSAFVPVEILSIDCVSVLETGETGTFTVSVNADATQPITYRWDFDDGTTGTGMSVTHSWSTPGTYNVTVTADNGRATDTASCTVTVEAPPAPPEIISINASETRFEVCEPVTVEFDANVQGDTPITYEWDFGDGTTATGPEVSHTYSEVGTYTVTLTATNAAGSDTRTITITAEECRAGICYEITEMNSVFFGRNSSTLTAEGRAALEENIEIFEQCPNLCARLEGWAAAGERNAQALSEARAEAVEQFYVDNGLAASRFVTVGMGVMPGTTKKEGAAGARRVDTIPVQCVDLQ